jgi:hypothetical protein
MRRCRCSDDGWTAYILLAAIAAHQVKGIEPQNGRVEAMSPCGFVRFFKTPSLFPIQQINDTGRT